MEAPEVPPFLTEVRKADPRRTYTVAEIAAGTGLSESTLWRRLQRGRLKRTPSLSNKVMVAQVDLRRFLEADHYAAELAAIAEAKGKAVRS